MAFVWSRLALAAVLAVGGATAASAQAVRARCGSSCEDAPRLACATECPTIVVDLGEDAVDAPVVEPLAAGVTPPPRPATVVETVAPVAVPDDDHDVLAVAPKTSPPRS